MKRGAPYLILLLSLVPPLWCQTGTPAEKPGPRAAVRVKEPATAIWVNFVPIPSGAPVRSLKSDLGTLDLGRVSYRGGAATDGVTITRRKGSFVVSTVFGLRVGSASGTGTAKLVGMVTEVNANNRVSVDGVRLTVVPQVIQMALPCGAVTTHRLEIEVPTDAPAIAAQVAQSIAFQVVAN